jgi:type II secretory pathway component GspD/PulD (secretin)
MTPKLFGMMGGLTQTIVTVSKDGLPFLSDLPIIGSLFGHKQRTESRSELLILITPHITDEGQPGSPDGAGSQR